MMNEPYSPGSPDHTQWVILIIDDTLDNRVIVQTVLTNAGLRVYAASDATEAMAMLETITPTVILMDIRIPKINGSDLLHMMRANAETAHIPIIAFTAYAMQGDRERFLEEGFDGYIAKPFDMLSLFPQIRAVVYHHQARH
jgi:two-component system cell cycle response regulator DivK